jgi:hypothetical protein
MRKNKKRDEEIMARAKTEESLTDIAKSYGITKQRVEQIARGLHVPKWKRDEQFIESHAEVILNARRGGSTYEEIMKRFGLSRWAFDRLNEFLKRHDLNRYVSLFGTIGQRFGDWEIIDNHRVGDLNRFVSCRCVCGKTNLVEVRNLVEGKSSRCQSCAASLRMRNKNN